MKKLLLMLIGGMMSIAIYAQNISGTVVDANSGDPIIGATVMIKGLSIGTITDIDGKFSLKNTLTETRQLEIGFLGYQSKKMSVDSDSGDLGIISLSLGMEGLEEVVVTGTMDIVRDRRTPVAVSTISSRVLQSKSVGNVEFPEAMKNTPSVYVSNQTGFGDSQMFLRGFDQVNTAFLLNGQPINGMEDGRMYWSNWSGMADVASAIQIQRGLGSSKLAISSVGGTVNIITKTTDNTESGYVRFMTGNDAYLKGTVAYNSGLQGKWAYSVLLDHWQADNKWAEGTQGQGQNYFFSVGFVPNKRNSFNFLVTGAPQSHGQRWSQSEETLREDPKFNQHWGLDGDTWKSERFNYYHKPVINLNWDFEINEKSKLSSVLYASFGRGGGTGNYGSSGNRLRTADGQIDFTGIRAVNTADADGIGYFGENYARRSSVNNHQWYGNVTNFEHQLNEKVSLSAGADLRFYTGDHFRQLVDLFGLNSYQDNFRHATRGDDYTISNTYEANPWKSLFDFAPEGDRIAYDYSEQINYQGLFGQIEYADDAFTTFFQAAASNQSYQREGRWSDLGKSEKVSKIGYNAKAGASYSLNNENIVFANAGYYSRQPFLDNIFENIRYSNDLTSPEIDNEAVVGLEIGYKYESDNLRVNLNGYRTSWDNRSLVTVFDNDNNTPDDDTDDFTQRNLERGIGQIHMGFEIELAYKVGPLNIKAFSSIGDWKFTEVDKVTAFNDDTGVILEEFSGVDLSDVHVPNAPQVSYGIGAEYKIIEGLSVDADFGFYDKIYRRDNFDSDDVVLREEIGTLPSYSVIDAGVSYRLPIGTRSLILRANVFNVFDSFYLNQTDPFGVLNGNGRTWNASAKFLF